MTHRRFLSVCWRSPSSASPPRRICDSGRAGAERAWDDDGNRYGDDRRSRDLYADNYFLGDPGQAPPAAGRSPPRRPVGPGHPELELLGLPRLLRRDRGLAGVRDAERGRLDHDDAARQRRTGQLLHAAVRWVQLLGHDDRERQRRRHLGFKIDGHNFDSNSRLQGTLTVTGVQAPPTPKTVALLSAIPTAGGSIVTGLVSGTPGGAGITLHGGATCPTEAGVIGSASQTIPAEGSAYFTAFVTATTGRSARAPTEATSRTASQSA